jgi:signal transduction histidine kinase
LSNPFEQKDTNPVIVKNESSFTSAEDKSNKLFSNVKSVYNNKRQHSGVPQTTVVIQDSNQTEMVFSNLLKNAKEEILIVYPSTSALMRQKHFMIDLLNHQGNENMGIRIMSPLDRKIRNLFSLSSNKQENKHSQNFIVREIAKPQRIRSTILMVDKKYLLTIELNEDSKSTFKEASGTSTYSTSKPTILSYVSIFDSLWNQAELYENLRNANEKLVENERLEREFINTAAHELRTPTQAITGYSELDDELFEHLLKDKKEMKEPELERMHEILYNHHENISRNATRLENLINNLLDVARIDSHQKNMIMLQKEKVDLVKEIKDLLDYHIDQKVKGKNIKVTITNETLFVEHYWIQTDRSRLNQVLNNLIDNAIKFSNQDGSLKILIYDNTTNQTNENKICNSDNLIQNNVKSANIKSGLNEIFIAISDSGKGISPSILPRLFEKFITNSDSGTGLGLYISKKLVEAMGGRIWAFNNEDEKGATFVFSLPVIDVKYDQKVV